MRKYYNKISLWSRFVNFAFIFTNDKKNSNSEANAKKYIRKLAKSKKKYKIPKKMGMLLEEKRMEVYSYNGRLNENSKRKILYIHGGSFVEEANKYQIKFAQTIAKKTDSTLIFPVYPLVPRGNYKIMYKKIEKLYNKLSENTEEIILLGDSAGGGFILSFAMYLRDNNMKQPSHIVMLSPWVDISMTNPKIYEDAKKDHMCGVDGTRYEGKLWASGLNDKDPLVSPIYGTFNDLGIMTIITGGNEILNSECHRFDKLLNENKIKHNFIEYKAQGHDFACFPTKEGKLATLDICNIINKGAK